jgi:[acyl-carrier-protein] S-malonyltransferase
MHRLRTLLQAQYSAPTKVTMMLRTPLRSSLSMSSLLLTALTLPRWSTTAFTPAYTRMSPGSRLFATTEATKKAITSATDDEFENYTAETVFMFPGQGAQFVGMAAETCKEFPAAAALFEKASGILGYDLLEVCTTGPKEKLDSTVISQPAIFVASMAAVEKLRATNPEVIDSATCALGLSLGEYSALCFAGALSFEDGVKITKIRGEAMQAASDAADSGMVSVIGLDKEKVAELCEAATAKSGAKIQIANYLCNGNYAVSGASAACDVVAEIAKPEFKARMTVKLAVAGAFHTEFMAPAVKSLEEVLKTVTITKPRIPVVSNVDASPHSDPDVIKQLLATQVTSPVMWEKSMETLLSKNFGQAYELGPGKVTAGILKRFDKKAECTNVEV